MPDLKTLDARAVRLRAELSTLKGDLIALTAEHGSEPLQEALTAISAAHDRTLAALVWFATEKSFRHCRIESCWEPAERGQLCALHRRPPDVDLERQAMAEADGDHRRIG